MTSDFAPTRATGPLDLVKKLDARVVVPALLLVAVGLCSIGAAQHELVAAQLRWCGIGFLITCVAMLVPYRRLLDLAWPLWVASTVMLVVVLLFGDARNGATRWLQFGKIGLQPSEFAKVAQVLVMARYIRFRRDHRTFRGLFVPFLITFVPMALILMQPDLGTAAMLVPMLFAMLWAAGARTKHLLAVVALAVAALPALYSAMPAEHYQRQRVDAFLAPVFRALHDAKKDDAGSPTETKPSAVSKKHDTFQRDEAEAAVATGGLAGHSVTDESPAQYGRVPESWTDFVFVVHAEEWGFAGVLLLFALWAALLGGLTLIASEL